MCYGGIDCGLSKYDMMHLLSFLLVVLSIVEGVGLGCILLYCC